MQYSEGLKETMVTKMLGPDGHSATSLSRETGIALSTLKGWRRSFREKAKGTNEMKSTRGQRSAQEKLRLVEHSGALSEEQLGVFLRKEGLHFEELERIRTEVRQAALDAMQPAKPKGRDERDQRIRSLEKELARKEKALAEAAALLVLSKKVQALWEGTEDKNTAEGSDKRS